MFSDIVQKGGRGQGQFGQLNLTCFFKASLSRKCRIKPPNTAQIVKTKLLALVLPTESLLSLSVASGILKLKW